jgi:hypothetical protein
MASAYRPRHQTKCKYNSTTNNYIKLHFMPKQLKHIIPTPPTTTHTTKSTPNKYQKSNKKKPKKLSYKITRPLLQYRYPPKNKPHHTFKPHLNYKLHPKQRSYSKLNLPRTSKQLNSIIHIPNSVKYSKPIQHLRYLLRHGSHQIHNPPYKLGAYPNPKTCQQNKLHPKHKPRLKPILYPQSKPNSYSKYKQLPTNNVASAYRPRHKKNRKTHLTNWTPTLMTNQVPKHYTNLYTLLKQHKNIILILHHSPSTTKLTPLKNLNPNKTKPNTINIYRYSPIIASTSRIELIKIPNYTIDYLKHNPITQCNTNPNFTDHPNVKIQWPLSQHKYFTSKKLYPKVNTHPKYRLHHQHKNQPKPKTTPLANQLKIITPPPPQHIYTTQKLPRSHLKYFPHPRYSSQLKHDLHPRNKLHPNYKVHLKHILHPKIKLYPNHKRLQPHSKYISHPKHRLHPRHNSHQKNKLHPKNKATSTHQPHLSINIKTHLKNKCSKNKPYPRPTGLATQIRTNTTS